MSPDEFSAALQALGLRQSDYARLIEVSQKTLWTWTAGRVPIPKLAAEHVRLLLAVNALHRTFITGLPGTGPADDVLAIPALSESPTDDSHPVSTAPPVDA